MGRKPTPPRQRVCRYCGAQFVTQGNGQQLRYCNSVCAQSARKAAGGRGHIPVGKVLIRSQDGKRGRVAVDAAGLPCFEPDE